MAVTRASLQNKAISKQKQELILNVIFCFESNAIFQNSKNYLVRNLMALNFSLVLYLTAVRFDSREVILYYVCPECF